MAVFIKDPKGWYHWTEDRNGPFGRHMQSAGDRLVDLARRQVGVDTGNLRRSINSSVNRTGQIVVRVGSNNPIAYMHHEGTKAHEIRPRRAKVLRFVQHGVVRYAMRVWHPGTAANRYLTDNLPKVI